VDKKQSEKIDEKMGENISKKGKRGIVI